MKTFKTYYEQKDRSSKILKMSERLAEIKNLQAMIKNPDPRMMAQYGEDEYIKMLRDKAAKLIHQEKNKDAEDNIKTVAKNVVAKAAPHIKEIGKKAMQAAAHAATDAIAKKAHSAADKIMARSEDAQDRCKRKADSVYGKKTSAYKSGAIVRCRKGKIWKKK